MTRLAPFALLAVLITAVPAPAGAVDADNDKATSAERATWPTTPLAELVDLLRKRSGKTILIDRHVPPAVVVGTLKTRDLTYPLLLSILRNNDLAAVAIDGVLNIIPVDNIRQYPLPVIDDNDEMPGDEWVTRAIPVKNAKAMQFVPIFRPLLPRQGHLVANTDSNTLLIVDRYANVRRIVQLVRQLDDATPAQRE